jgi:hypothetical protein
VDSCKIHFLYSKKCKIHLQSGTICSLVRFAKRTTGVVPFQRKLLLTTDTRRVKGEYRSKGGWSPAWHPLPCATVVECQQPVTLVPDTYSRPVGTGYSLELRIIKQLSFLIWFWATEPHIVSTKRCECNSSKFECRIKMFLALWDICEASNMHHISYTIIRLDHCIIYLRQLLD